MPSGTRLPSWKERENNKRRERKRRAYAANVFSGLRTYGDYNLPKHCDNNEVLKAVCNEAGWIVEADGTTYRKGQKPTEGGSALVTPCFSYDPSPGASFNPSPVSSSFPSPNSISHFGANLTNGNSLIPWLKNLSAVSPSATSSKMPYPYFHGNSISAPVTPPMSSPNVQSPRSKMDWIGQTARMGWGSSSSYSFFPSSTPTSPGRQTQPDSEWFSGGPTSSTFSLIAPSPFTVNGEAAGGSGSRMWTPGQSGTCSLAIAASHDQKADIPMAQVIHDDFAFRNNKASRIVNAWGGERIHDESESDDLELTLGMPERGDL